MGALGQGSSSWTPVESPVLVWGPQGYARHEGGPPPWSRMLLGWLRCASALGWGELTLPVILSVFVLGHISKLEHLGPAEVASHSWFLPLCQIGVGNLLCAGYLLSQLPGEVLYLQ